MKLDKRLEERLVKECGKILRKLYLREKGTGDKWWMLETEKYVVFVSVVFPRIFKFEKLKRGDGDE